jgi:hypothetical protein
MPWGDDETIERILADTKVWAVVGLRDDPRRPAWAVAHFLQQHGKQIVPVHPHPQVVHGEQGFGSLLEVPFPVDVVDVFVNSTRAGAVADDAIRIGAKAVWFQLGVVDETAYDRVRTTGTAMVMDHCPQIEWPRLGPISP